MAQISPRRTNTRLRLYEAAVTLVAEQGFSATSVESIAERAGVAKGTVYYNFAHKNELFEGLLTFGGEILEASLREAADRVAARGGGAVEALEEMVRAALTLIVRRPALVRLYVAEVWRTNRAWHDALAQARGRSVAVIEEVLRRGVADRELDEATDPALTASGVFGSLLVAALDWQTFQPHRSLDEMHTALLPLLPCRAVPAVAEE